MALPIAIKQIACERLFHFHPTKTIARELGISTGAVRDWRIFINKGDFEWITDQYVKSRTPRIRQMVSEQIDGAKNEKELRRNIEEMLICYESLFEEVMKDCKDELKKKELQLYLDQLREVLASL